MREAHKCKWRMCGPGRVGKCPGCREEAAVAAGRARLMAREAEMKREAEAARASGVAVWEGAP
jgi:hypothetical protein